MKKILLIIITVSLIFSCEIDEGLPQIETITNGKKWTLSIGSSPTEVYSQLQELSLEKSFHQIQILDKEPYSKPEDIKSDISLYHYIYLEATSVYPDRILFNFDQDKVESIEKGGALIGETLSQWPEDTPKENSIQINDPISQIYTKLLSIYEIPAYQKYQISLINKILDRAYDPDMGNYDKWHFSFQEDINSGRVGISSVFLFFKKGKLTKIRHEYNEADIVN